MSLKKEFIIVIPARYESTRLPGKPLVDICGKSMISRVFDVACKTSASEILVATDDDRIVDECRKYKINVVLTSNRHQSGTDRISELAEINSWDDNQIIVNLQGDEPLMPFEIIDQVANILIERPDYSMSTLVTNLKDKSEFLSKDTAKVILSKDNNAIYFSRAAIPFSRDGDYDFNCAMRHIGIYAYRVKALKEISRCPVTNLEEIEKLEQLRPLWLGINIAVEVAHKEPYMSVDTYDDLEKVRKHFITVKS